MIPPGLIVIILPGGKDATGVDTQGCEPGAQPLGCPDAAAEPSAMELLDTGMAGMPLTYAQRHMCCQPASTIPHV